MRRKLTQKRKNQNTKWRVMRMKKWMERRSKKAEVKSQQRERLLIENNSKDKRKQSSRSIMVQPFIGSALLKHSINFTYL